MHMEASRGIGVFLLAGVLGVLSSGTTRAQDPKNDANTASAQLPKDVYPDSRDRLPLPKRSDTDEYGNKVFDQLPATTQLPATVHSIRLYSPVAKSLEEADHYLNFETGLPDPLVEIAILVTAREMDSQFEWTQNEPHGLDPGNSHHIEPAIIDIIKYDKPVVGLGEKETAIISLGREMFGQRKVSSATFAHVLRLFGRRGTVDLVELMANYSAAAAELTAFDQQLKAGQRPLLPLRQKHQ
jgi:4-carboxymuconolactone decarboxylase